MHNCTRWRKVTKVTNPISDFTFLSTAKSGKSRIKNPFLDAPKGTHPKCQTSHSNVTMPRARQKLTKLLTLALSQGRGLLRPLSAQMSNEITFSLQRS